MDRLGSRKQKVAELGATALTFIKKMTLSVIRRCASLLKDGPDDVDGLVEHALQGHLRQERAKDTLAHPVVRAIHSGVSYCMKMGEKK